MVLYVSSYVSEVIFFTAIWCGPLVVSDFFKLQKCFGLPFCATTTCFCSDSEYDGRCHSYYSKNRPVIPQKTVQFSPIGSSEGHKG